MLLRGWERKWIMARLREATLDLLEAKWKYEPEAEPSDVLLMAASRIGLDPLEIIRSAEYSKNPNNYREES
jgi:hypothetical protein